MFVNHPKSVTAKLRQLQPTSGLANAICIEICERHGYDALFEQVSCFSTTERLYG